jgi:putative radical SAM enzyme (TIGR03279 family)
MTKPHPAHVDLVRPGSAADRAGIIAGDKVIRANGREPRDYIDYRYLTAESRLTLTVKDARGEHRSVRIEKALDEDPGLRFTEDVFDGIRACGNRCPFCFVSQLPRGLRPALYVRDDDYRLSFLHGNFVTLTNLTPADQARIAKLHLSPLYVSVHATEPEVRREIFGGPTPNVMSQMRRLGARGIEFHTQIVVCPGLNDGAHLARTVRDLAALFPAVRSIGVVPVGLTRHRSHLPRVQPVTPATARELIAQVKRSQRGFVKKLGSRLVFAADEIYLLLGLPIPGRAHYEGFPQLSNGIGCARLFLDGVRRLRPPRLRRPVRVTLATGEMAAPLVMQLARKMEDGERVQARVCVVPNRFLGRSVTTAGLLSGRDIAHALLNGEVGDLVIAPGAAIREGDGFLDGMSLEELSRRVGATVILAVSPAQANAAVRRFGARSAKR